MTRFENTLGGRIVVMGMTLENNFSQSLFNYRRVRLMQELLTWCSDSFVYVKEAPKVFLIMNEPRKQEKETDLSKKGVVGMLTIINLCDDALEGVTLHLPPSWSCVNRFLILDRCGKWKDCSFEKEGNVLKTKEKLNYCDPVYIQAVNSIRAELL